MGRTCRYFFSAIATFAATASLEAADLTVPRLELATQGSTQDGDFVLASHAAADIAIQGGYKFGAALHFAFESANLEETLGFVSSDPTLNGDGVVDETEYKELLDVFRNQNPLSFRLAKAIVRQPFDLPVELSYFIGRDDVFCSGDDFPFRFGTDPIATSFRGFAYDPDGIGGNPAFRYDGIHEAIGTGLSVALTRWDDVIPILYAYQDSMTSGNDGRWEAGHYSADLRLLVNFDRVKLETFAGATSGVASLGLYRVGALAFFSSGVGADFLAQVGFTGWDPNATLSIDDWYFLFEPRLDFGLAAIIITLFSHPVRYLQRVTPEEEGATDINAKILIGNAQEQRVEGGIEGTVRLRSNTVNDADNFSFTVSPFLGLMTEGVRWDFKVAIHPFRYDRPDEMFEASVGVRTAF